MAGRKVKKLLCAAVAAVALLSTGTTVFAGTIPFTVTVGGTGTQDPLSKKEAKRNDGDIYAHFTGVTFSRTGDGVYVRSYKKDNSNFYTKRAHLRSEKAGVTMSRKYLMDPVYEVYYYMRARPVADRITVTGRYCP